MVITSVLHTEGLQFDPGQQQEAGPPASTKQQGPAQYIPRTTIHAAAAGKLLPDTWVLGFPGCAAYSLASIYYLII